MGTLLKKSLQGMGTYPGCTNPFGRGNVRIKIKAVP